MSSGSDSLAGKFFDARVAPLLAKDGVSATDIAAHRQEFVELALQARDAMRNPYVTRTGKVLSDSDVDALAEEAERGYDVPAPPDLCRWEINQKFRVTRGSFDREAESALYAEGVRREMSRAAFRFVSYVEATIDRFALRQARGKLYDLLRPYDVNVFIYDVRIVCMGVPK